MKEPQARKDLIALDPIQPPIDSMNMGPVQTPVYAPPTGRVGAEELAQQASVWVENPVLHQVLEAMDGFVLLINRQHQILIANLPFLKAAHVAEVMDLRGLRLGEVLGCTHVAEGSDGCGTSPACAQCGVAQAVSCVKQRGIRVSYEALLSCRQGHRWEAMELRVHASPFSEAGSDEILLVCQDISAEKRREVLESVFFHDVLNSLSGLRGWVNVLSAGLGDVDRAKAKLDLLSAQVIEEVRSQRLVTQAERGELALNSMELKAESVVRDCAALVQEHPAAKMKTVSVLPTSEGLRCHADPDLLRRVLVNMTLNALEASPIGGTVTLKVAVSAGVIHFQVHNSGCIPPGVQGRLFQRSFSTKATRGRGLGTYSMKLFGETYLGGQVSFRSAPEVGTTFELALPLPQDESAGD